MPPAIILLPYLFGCLLGLLVLPITLPIIAIYYVYNKLTTKGINSWNSLSPQSPSHYLPSTGNLNFTTLPHPINPRLRSRRNYTPTPHLNHNPPQRNHHSHYNNQRAARPFFNVPVKPCAHACRHRASLCSPRSLRDARWTLSVARCTSHVEQCSLSVVTCRWSPRAGRWTKASFLGHLSTKTRTI